VCFWRRRVAKENVFYSESYRPTDDGSSACNIPLQKMLDDAGEKGGTAIINRPGETAFTMPARCRRNLFQGALDTALFDINEAQNTISTSYF